MEEFASDIALMFLVCTPLLVFAKVVHGLAAQRLSFASRGSRGVKVELVAWLLLGAVDSHTFALWSGVANQAEDLCAKYRPELGDNVYLSGGYFFEYPVNVQCVWPAGGTVTVTPWPLNAATALFAAAAVTVTAYTVISAYRRSRHNTAR
ncbi:hypothetical protein [Actinophytocola gossypii]|uniref:Uncharacterized protein n=1 Tax=Actinophytocola gossypii TaxID=2812003 RepID=A0ABT2J3M9_9PSEU|nr:hypothetical protein [Actinophytocola gossypii]MCT2582456.1 hypothetical protein [Actinophytocola gossypii]